MLMGQQSWRATLFRKKLAREEFIPGSHNAKNTPHVQRSKIFLSTFHIKLGPGIEKRYAMGGGVRSWYEIISENLVRENSTFNIF